MSLCAHRASSLQGLGIFHRENLVSVLNFSATYKLKEDLHQAPAIFFHHLSGSTMFVQLTPALRNGNSSRQYMPTCSPGNVAIPRVFRSDLVEFFVYPRISVKGIPLTWRSCPNHSFIPFTIMTTMTPSPPQVALNHPLPPGYEPLPSIEGYGLKK